jgi:transcriptional regulator with XRE-family HTH domain
MKKPFNQWLRDELIERDLSQREFSRRLKIDESNVSNYILGKRIPNTRTLIKIVLVLSDDGPQERLVKILLGALSSIENIGNNNVIE